MALTRNRLIQVKKESTYGTSSSPQSIDTLLVRNLEITPIEADVVSRDLIRGYFGSSPQLLANTRVSTTFQVEMAGSGTAGTAPRYGCILQACGLSETIVNNTSVTYAPVSSSFSSATIYFNNDGTRHILTGCRGTFTLNAEVGQIPTIDFTMIGVYNAPHDWPSVEPQAGGIFSAQASPLIFKQGNTSGFQFFSYNGCLQSVSLDIANETVYRELVGCTKNVLITNRAPNGTVMIEAVSLTTKDFFSIAQTETTGNLTFLHGTTAGNRVTLLSGQCDITNPTYADQDGVQMLSIPYVALPTTAGNDELSLAFT
jgi:hypothetical protein